MLIKKIVSSLLLLSALPVSAYAIENVEIINQTNQDASFYGYYGRDKEGCSGPEYLVKAHDKYPISVALIKSACFYKDCVIHLYFSTNCSGEKVATAIASKSANGIASIEVHQPDKYRVTWSRTSVTITNASSKTWLHALFG